MLGWFKKKKNILKQEKRYKIKIDGIQASTLLTLDEAKEKFEYEIASSIFGYTVIVSIYDEIESRDILSKEVEVVKS